MWTLVRHKNGQEVPIKVSVLDVFRSGSKKNKNLGERRHIVRTQANTKATVAAKVQGCGGGGGDKKPNNNNNNNSSWSTSEPETWTPEDDMQLRELKTGGNMSWKQILAALGDNHTSESQMKARYKEIEGKVISGSADGSSSGGAEKSKEEERKVKAEKAKAEGLARQAALKAGKGGQQPKKGNLKNSTSSAPSTTSQEKQLKDVAAKYDREKWLAVASKHFDRTGQRISPEMAREMCGATD